MAGSILAKKVGYSQPELKTLMGPDFRATWTGLSPADNMAWCVREHVRDTVCTRVLPAHTLLRSWYFSLCLFPFLLACSLETELVPGHLCNSLRPGSLPGPHPERPSTPRAPQVVLFT